jgi:hypothetical protein
MSQGIFIHNERPSSKKDVKEALLTAPETVSIEAISMFGGDYEGPATELPKGRIIHFVGPDPHTSRKFYGTIRRNGNGRLVCL